MQTGRRTYLSSWLPKDPYDKTILNPARVELRFRTATIPLHRPPMNRAAVIGREASKIDVKASIIIPTYNYGRYLAQSIESALGQTRTAHEVIVVDAHSTDDSAEIAGRYPVTLVKSERAQVVEAMAAGVDASSGDCFTILGADDYMAANYLEVTVPLLESRADVGFVYTSLTLFGAIHDYVPARRYSVARLLASNYVHGSSLIRRSAYDSTAGLHALDLAMYEDWYIVLDLVEEGWRGARTNDTTLYYRQHANTRNKTGGEIHQETIRRLMADHPTLYRPNPAIWCWLHEHLFRKQPQLYIALSLLACRLQQGSAC